VDGLLRSQSKPSVAKEKIPSNRSHVASNFASIASILSVVKEFRIRSQAPDQAYFCQSSTGTRSGDFIIFFLVIPCSISFWSNGQQTKVKAGFY